ncbi:MAG: glycosyltransferase [Desulfohalobiaceae bacterium]|nr:glycosyltransferase [Desulfohalobiaceae bacterium]
MHTLHCIGSKRLGGAERWFLRLTAALYEEGWNTERLVRRGSELDGLEHPLTCHALPLRTVWDPLSRHQVSRLIARQRPDIVQTYMGRGTRLTRLSRNGGPLHIARLGGYYKLRGYRHAHIWFGNTRGICDYLIRSGFSSKKVFHLPNFVEKPAPVDPGGVAELRNRLGLSPDDLVLLTPGRFVPFKGHRYLLQALPAIPNEVQGRRIRLLLLGKGRLGPDLQDLSRELLIDDRIIWGGWHEDPTLFYHLADLVVFPSLEREPFGNVILEAWSHAKPVVCTAFWGALEYTRHGEDVWQVPCRDALSLARGVSHVLQDEHLLSLLAENGFQRIQEDFSKTKVLKDHMTIYRSLVK